MRRRDERNLGKEEEMLAMEILETMGIDVKPAVCSGLIGIKGNEKDPCEIPL